MKNKEGGIQKAIMDYLRLKGVVCFKHRNVGIYKKDTGSYIPLPSGEKGISDIIGCLPDGRFLAVEVKCPGKKPSPDQLDFLKRIWQSGGVGLVAYSIDDVMGAFEGNK